MKFPGRHAKEFGLYSQGSRSPEGSYLCFRKIGLAKVRGSGGVVVAGPGLLMNLLAWTVPHTALDGPFSSGDPLVLAQQ